MTPHPLDWKKPDYNSHNKWPTYPWTYTWNKR